MRGSIRFFLLILTTIGCAVVFLALAQVNPPAGAAAAIKIGVVNSNAVFNQTAEGKRELTQLNQFVEGRQKEYEGQAAELQKLRDQLSQAQGSNPETRLEMQRAIEEKELTLRRFQEDAQRDVQKRQEEVFGRLQEKLQKSIQDYAEKNGYHLILQRDDSQAYVSPSLEITQDIVNHYNQQHPVTASAFQPDWRQTPTSM